MWAMTLEAARRREKTETGFAALHKIASRTSIRLAAQK
jgi:hypothetical protein